MKPVTLYKGSTGLNTVDDPVRIPFDPQTGIGGLAEAVNVSITRSGRIGRRKGYEKKKSGDFHSLFSDGFDAYVVENRADDSAIYQIGTDYSLRGIRSGLTMGRRVSWCRHPKGRFYYSNGSENGYIWGGKSFPWEKGEYVGPDTSREFFGPPAGSHLEYAFGRMFIAEDNVVWWSEPYREDLYDKARNFWQFETCVRMIKRVRDGMFVSDEKGIYFMAGTNPAEAAQVWLTPYPALEWSDCPEYIDGQDIGIESGGPCALWVSTEGLCLGLPTGQLLNLNRSQVVYPENITQGASLLRGMNLIHTMR